MTTDTTLPCFVCAKPLRSAVGGVAYNQPYQGTTFVTGGHYGSTVFDPLDGTSLELNICDSCLVLRKARVLHNKPEPSSWEGP